MRFRSTALLAAAAAALAGCSAEPGADGADGSAAGPGRTRATVTHVSDGDTITLSGLGKTRLIGVDTPEVFGRAECYGAEASAYTKRVLSLGRHVTYSLGPEPRDRYGRALAYVWLGDGQMFNTLLAERGYAVQLTIPPNVDHAGEFRAAVARARTAQRGLWSRSTCAGDANEPVAPGDQHPNGTPPAGAEKRCSDFSTQAEAQRWLDAHPGAPMDGDGDGRACETLP
jgi:micrococcal nuclease